MRKKIFYIIILLIALLYSPTVFAANITGCESVLPGVVIDEKIPNTVHTLIVIIKIVVPIILVIFGMIDLAKGVVAQKEDEIKKGQHIFVKRLIAAAIVFFVISIVQLLIRFVAGGDSEGIMNCANCFINGANTCVPDVTIN